jgi:hypothetical protein
MKLMSMTDIERMRGKSLKKIHLARYERAFNRNVDDVLDVPCPHCSAAASVECDRKSKT